MSAKAFAIRLLCVTLGASALLAVLHWLLPPLRSHAGFTAGSVALFMLVCIGLFFAGKSAAGSTSKLAFNNLVSVSVFGKMLLAIAALFLYQRVAKPADQWFVAVFLFVYVVYTVFEVWFMTKLAKT